MTARTPSTRVARGSVVLLGAGPGDLGLLTLRGAEVLAEADLVVSEGPLPAAAAAHVPAEAELLDLAGSAPQTPSALGRSLASQARKGRRVVHVVAGDALLATGGAAVDAVLKAGLSAEVVPGVPAAVASPAYAGIPVTRPGTATSFAVHPLDRPPSVVEADTTVLTGDASLVAGAAAALTEAGLASATPVAVVTGGTTLQQVTVVSTLEALAGGEPAAAEGEQVVVVAGAVVKLRERLSWFEAAPLFGWRVLVPRTRAQAGSVSARLRALGATPVEVPTIAVEPPRSPAAMDRAIKGLVSGRYQWVAFTSTNAVKAVREKLEEVGLDARAFAGVKIAAVGEATGDALRAFGIRPDLVPSGQQSSEGLLEEWAPYDDVLDPIDRVFLPRADIATETLVAGLKERGWAVDDITAYRTVRASPPAAATREALKGGGFDAVLFTSSSTVRNLVGIAGKPHESTVLAAIGPQTEATMTDLGLRVDVVAEVASTTGLVDALADLALARRVQQADAPEQPPSPVKRPSRTRSRPSRAKAAST
jgi:uroporphyrinogen III methyltransferase / synthase